MSVMFFFYFVLYVIFVSTIALQIKILQSKSCKKMTPNFTSQVAFER